MGAALIGVHSKRVFTVEVFLCLCDMLFTQLKMLCKLKLLESRPNGKGTEEGREKGKEGRETEGGWRREKEGGRLTTTIFPPEFVRSHLERCPLGNT